MRYLVCDDEKHIADMIGAHLEKVGHQVKVTYDPRIALELLVIEEFDRVVLDVMMPYVDGFQILKWIRNNERTKDLWVGVMTAQWNPDWRVQYEERYGEPQFELIPKPFKLEEWFGPESGSSGSSDSSH